MTNIACHCTQWQNQACLHWGAGHAPNWPCCWHQASNDIFLHQGLISQSVSCTQTPVGGVGVGAGGVGGAGVGVGGVGGVGVGAGGVGGVGPGVVGVGVGGVGPGVGTGGVGVGDELDPFAWL